MTKKKDSKPKADDVTPSEGQANVTTVEAKSPVLRSYFFPTLGRSVKAGSREEALTLISEQKDEGGDDRL